MDGDIKSINNYNAIQKPLTVARTDFLQGITELINKTPMPFFVVEDCLNLIASDIHTLAVEQEKQEREFYNKQVEEGLNKQEKE